MPYAQCHYPFAHQADFQAHFPADFICEGVDQTRGWFYSLLAIGVAVLDQPVYRHVVVNELVLDGQGQKMSKSRGNVVDPWKVIEEHGADAVRPGVGAQAVRRGADPQDRRRISQRVAELVWILRPLCRGVAAGR
jgi:isoleucyl-tRNA synthetase